MPGRRPWVPKGRAAAFVCVAAAYLVAGAVGYATWALSPSLPGVFRVAAADLAATLTVFAGSLLFDNSSLYDPYWSVAPIPIAAGLAIAGGPAQAVRRVAVVALVTAWGIRLTWNWARGWSGFAHEDWRYVDLRARSGRAYWLVSALGLHLVPTLSVLLGMLPLWPALGGGAPLGPLDALAFAVTACAIALEAVADHQLRAFRRVAAPGEILRHGLWSRSRHPNYLGEIGLWWGLWLFGLAGDPRAWWWTLAGPLWITALFVFISIPLLEKRSLARRSGYADHRREVPALLPRLLRPRR